MSLCCGSQCFCEYLEVCVPLDVEGVFPFGVHTPRNIVCVSIEYVPSSVVCACHTSVCL